MSAMAPTATEANPQARTEPGRATTLASMWAFAHRELRDALASRWFVLYTIAFAVLAVSVSFMSLASSGSNGFAGFGRTAAGLLNMVMLVVPLMAITAGCGAVASERERGTLLYLLAQPVTRVELLLGKFVGLTLALCAALCLGFGSSALVLIWKAGSVGAASLLMLVGFTCLLAVAMLACGLLISVFARKTGIANGIGLFVWLTLVFLSDLGLMAGTILFKLRVEELFALAILNPLQAFKMAVIVKLNAALDVLGPAGTYASQTFGNTLPWLLISVLVGFGALNLIAALIAFSRRSTV